MLYQKIIIMNANLKFILGKVYRVTFKDGRVLTVVPRGGEPMMFDVDKHKTYEGIDWLDGHISIEEVGDTITNEKGGVE